MSRNEKCRFLLIALMIAGAFCLTYYFRAVYETGTIFTHFFYVPIVLACVWWKRKGLIVTFVLATILIVSKGIFQGYTVNIEDYVRAAMLAIVSLIVVVLSEKLSFIKDELVESEKKYRKIFETTGTAMTIIENDTTISLANKEFEQLSGFSREEVEGRKSWTEFIPESDLERMQTYHYTRREGQPAVPKAYTALFLTRSGEVRHVIITVDVIPGSDQSVASLMDITELKQATETQKMLQKELSDTLTKVLSGFIPICANCKKIRDEKDNWIQMESYINDHTDAMFSHGICPECKQTLYADFIAPEHIRNVT